MNQQKALSIIIVNYNSWEPMKSLFKTLAKQTMKDFEVIAVDNASTLSQPEGIFAPLKQASIDHQFIAHDHNAGFAAANNIGAEAATGQYLLFCNPDIEIPGDGLDTLLRVYQDNDVHILSCGQKNQLGQAKETGGSFPGIARYAPLLGGFFKKHKAAPSQAQIHPVDWVSGSVVLIGRDEFDRLRGWDDDFFMYMEDVDLCHRAHRQQMTVGNTMDTIWVHHHGLSSQSDTADRVRSKTSAIISKHTYISKYFNGLRRATGHAFVFIKYAPELVLAALLSWLIPAKELRLRRQILSSYLRKLQEKK
ncbi:glycosyltransferase family 2 protein [Marinicella sediminis]|uniref:Glycosyltransferase family 2 protein n=1 Tax=Marinicella sediminis TaxID=1792834 RepID=A0ABV7J639_9GAMM|nr:glycosyltransferase family 2 protein [Marinicella sediminis]